MFKLKALTDTRVRLEDGQKHDIKKGKEITVEKEEFARRLAQRGFVMLTTTMADEKEDRKREERIRKQQARNEMYKHLAETKEYRKLVAELKKEEATIKKQLSDLNERIAVTGNAETTEQMETRKKEIEKELADIQNQIKKYENPEEADDGSDDSHRYDAITKNDIIKELTQLGIEFDKNANKPILAELLEKARQEADDGEDVVIGDKVENEEDDKDGEETTEDKDTDEAKGTDTEDKGEEDNKETTDEKDDENEEGEGDDDTQDDDDNQDKQEIQQQ